MLFRSIISLCFPVTIGGEVKTIYTGIRIKETDGPNGGKEEEIKEVVEPKKEVKLIDVLETETNNIHESTKTDNQESINSPLEAVKLTEDGKYIINGYILSKKEIDEYKVEFIKEGENKYAEPDVTYVIEFTNQLTNKKDYLVRPSEKFIIACLENKFKTIDN